MSQPKWWELAPEPLEGEPAVKPSGAVVSEKLAIAEKHIRAQQQSGEESRWLQRMAGKGTLGDRVSALAVLVQRNPLGGVDALGALATMARKRGRAEAEAALGALRDVLCGALLPPGRRLRFFFEQPLTSARATPRHLAWWLFEDRLKKAVAEFVAAADAASRDPISARKETAVRAAYDVLRASGAGDGSGADPALMAIVVNKLGDQQRATCGRVATWLAELAAQCPGVVPLLVEECARFLYRRNVSKRAQYYAVVVLGSLALSRRLSALANRLIGIYLSFFGAATSSAAAAASVEDTEKGKKKKKKSKRMRKLLEKRAHKAMEEALDSRLLAALMTGVHRAFPYADMNDETFERHVDALFRVARVSSFNKSVQAFQLLLQFMTSRQALSDRFFTALYERLLSPEALTSTRQAVLCNLIFRSLSVDPDNARAAAFAKRMVQVSCYASPAFSCALLLTLSELMNVRPAIRTLLQAPDTADSGCDITPPAGAAASEASFGVYKPLKRDPRFANAQATSMWEMCLLANHFHPSASKFASTLLLENRPIEYGGNPLESFTLSNFLDRFSFKNPKAKFREQPKHKDEADEEAEMLEEDTEKPQLVGRQLRVRPSAVLPAVNAPESLQRSIASVPEEERFFHEFFRLKSEQESVPEEAARDLAAVAGESESEEDDGYAGLEDAIAGEERDRTTGHFEDVEEEDVSEVDELLEDVGDVGTTAAAAAAASGSEEEDEDEEEEDGFGDEDEDEEEEDDDDVEVGGGRKKKKKKSSSDFASAEDFADLLESGKINEKQLAWETGERRKKRSRPAFGKKKTQKQQHGKIPAKRRKK